MRIIYAGTPEFAVPALQACIDDGHEIPLVLSQPDRPAGRGRRLHASPVKQAALAAGLRVEQPTRLDADAQAMLASCAADLMIVAAYGLILPEAILALPRFGCVNIHASLLPRWRGASPIQQSILAGDTESGLTLMQMDAGLDTGPILLTQTVEVAADETAVTLHDRLSAMSPQLIRSGIEQLAVGGVTPRVQDDGRACYAPRIDKRDGRIDWHHDAGRIDRQVRAYNPWPVAYAELDGARVRIWQATVLGSDKAMAASNARPARATNPSDTEGPGYVRSVSPDGIDVICGSGTLRIQQIQWPGGRRLTAAEAAHGRSIDGCQFA